MTARNSRRRWLNRKSFSAAHPGARMDAGGAQLAVKVPAAGRQKPDVVVSKFGRYTAA